MKKLIKKFVAIFFAPILFYYLKTDRVYHYKGISILVKKGVFHPAFFFSSKFLLKEALQLDLTNKKVLELGAGSGLISFYLAKKNAIITASDVSKIAIEGLHFNKKNLNLPIKIIESDLFNNIQQQVFDVVLINPPYYPKNPTNETEKAWYCGAEFQYFVNLFTQLKNYINNHTVVLMSLSEDCDITQIIKIAEEHGLHFESQKEKRLLWELNYIFSIKIKSA